MKKTVLLVSLLSAFTASAFASDFYAGGTVGSARNNNAGGGLTQTNDTSFSVLGGYKLSDTIAAELAYSDLGSITQGAARAKTTAYSLAAVATLPIAAAFSAYGKLGYGSARTTVSTSQVASHSDFTFGLGAQYDLNKNVTLRAGWDRVQLGDSVNVVRSSDDIYSLGAVYRF